MGTEEAKITLVEALIAAQKEFKQVKRTADNPFFKSRYADLAEVLDCVNEALWKHGLLVTQGPMYLPGIGPAVETCISHVGGEKREYVWPLLPAKQNDPQALGAAMTYGRRYSLMGALGLAPDDDDGNEASGRAANAANNPAKVVGKPAMITPNSGRSTMDNAAPIVPPANDNPAKITPGQLNELLPELEKFLYTPEMSDADKKAKRLEWVSTLLNRKVTSETLRQATFVEGNILLAAAKLAPVKKVK